MSSSQNTFDRERVRHPLKLRNLTVSSVRQVSPSMVRVTLSGPELEGFVSLAPADHVKVFFPAQDGTLTTPVFTANGIDRPATGTVISRDYTPFAFRPGSSGSDPELDIDFVLHGDEGPASAWAASATPGMPLAIAGPRGSHLPPSGIDRAVIVADETGLPAAARWLEALGPEIPVTALLAIEDYETSNYLEPAAQRELVWIDGPDRYFRLQDELGQLNLGPNSFVFLAGEAGALVPLRRYLRRELGLAKEQVDAHGYWKRGIVNLDHHAPLDPSDPD